jgi:uncharacterized membrane protein
VRLKNLDLIVAILVAVINMIWAQISHRPLVISVIFALPLVLVAPGYTLTRILLRKRSHEQPRDASNNVIVRPGLRIGRPAGIADHIVLSCGLSLAIDVLVGFALDVFPIGLQAQSWALALGLITTLFALLAMALQRGDIVKVSRRTRLRVTVYDCGLLGLAILVVSVAVWLSIIRPSSPQPGFSQFWMLPAAHHSCAVSVGVQSFETTPVTYRVVTIINGVQSAAWSSIVLAPQEKWNRVVTLPPRVAGSVYVEARLYRVNEPGVVYRNVHLTLHSLKGGSNREAQRCTV